MVRRTETCHIWGFRGRKMGRHVTTGFPPRLCQQWSGPDIGIPLR